MIGYIVAVELIGTPDGSIYDQLARYMSARYFEKKPTSFEGGPTGLPHSTYTGQSALNTRMLATVLRDEIQQSIWPTAKVLAISYRSAHQADPS